MPHCLSTIWTLAIAGRQPEGSDCLCCRVYGHCTVLGILTTNSQQMNSLWLIFPASFLTLVIVSFLTKKDTVVPVDEKTGPNEAQMEILKTIKRGYSNAGAIITSMTRFCNEHQLQAGHIHNALDSLEKSGYVKRKGQRLIAQLYFSLTEKGDAAACANMSETELKTIAVYGVDSQANPVHGIGSKRTMPR